jgi:hypothetical protein
MRKPSSTSLRRAVLLALRCCKPAATVWARAGRLPRRRQHEFLRQRGARAYLPPDSGAWLFVVLSLLFATGLVRIFLVSRRFHYDPADYVFPRRVQKDAVAEFTDRNQ